MEGELNVVTGAFGYTGKYITRKLLAMGARVKTLTDHPHRPHPFGSEVAAMPFRFDDPLELSRSLEGAATLYNTYWVRFPHGGASYGLAVENTRALLWAAEEAGIKRIVHISIANPSADSPLAYFRGKAEVEEAVKESRLSYAILRPTVLFGHEDILINNIAWLLRRFPVFVVPGSGRYRVQPVFVEDLAQQAVGAAHATDNIIEDAAGPETYAFDELVTLIRDAVGSRAGLVHLPPGAAFVLTSAMGLLVGDVILTRDEIDGLMAELLVSRQPPQGKTRLSQWLADNAESVGIQYASELARHYRHYS